MSEALAALGVFFLEKVSSDIVATSAGSINEKRKMLLMQKADEQARHYLLTHTTAEQYDAIDSYFAKEGIYSYDQVNENHSAIRTFSTGVIDDFFRLHPNHQVDRNRLEPILRQSLCQTCKSIVQQLSLSDRTILHQFYRQERLIRGYGEEMHAGFAEQHEILQQLLTTLSNGKIISDADTSELYAALLITIDSGNFEIANTIIEKLATLVEHKSKYYLTACKIRITYFTKGEESTLQYCSQFMSECPSEDILHDTTAFLISVNSAKLLAFFEPYIKDSLLKEVVKSTLATDPANLWTVTLDENGSIKTEYQSCSYVLWALGHSAIKYGYIQNAADIFTTLYKQVHTHWSKWYKCCSRLWVDCSLASNAHHSDQSILAKLKPSIDGMLEFQVFFELTNDTIYSNFVSSLLGDDVILSSSLFEYIWNQLSPRATSLPSSKQFWYAAHFSNWHEIDAFELKEYCSRQKPPYLWYAYLLHRVQDDPEFVLEDYEKGDTSIITQINQLAAIAQAASKLKSPTASIEYLELLFVSEQLLFAKAVLLAEISVQSQLQCSDHYLDQALEIDRKDQKWISVAVIRRLVNSLMDSGRCSDASTILEKYQKVIPDFKKLNLSILMGQEENSEKCRGIVDELFQMTPDDDYLNYCKGMLDERRLAGSGEHRLENAFHIHETPQYAAAILVSRLKKNKPQLDKVLEYLSHQYDAYYQYICGCTYHSRGLIQQAKQHFLQALLLCNGEYNENLFSTYFSIHSSDNELANPPTEVAVDTCFILTTISNGESLKLWIHNESIVIPASGSNFAGYTHISSTSPQALLLMGLHQNDLVTLNGAEFYISSINHGEIIAFKYCMDLLLVNGVLKSLSFDTNYPEQFLTELKAIFSPQNEQLDNVIQAYSRDRAPLPLQILVHVLNRPYFSTIQALLYDPKIRFWSGCDGDSIEGDCILTNSTIAVLSSLGISPSDSFNKKIRFFIAPATRNFIEASVRSHQSSHSSGSLGFDEYGKAFFVENTSESRRIMNRYYSLIQSWSRACFVCDELCPEEYPEDLLRVKDAIGISDIETILLAKKHQFTILSDDLAMRQYFHASGIKNANAIDVIMEVNFPLHSITDHIVTLLHANYQTPISTQFLKYLSCQFDAQPNEKALETLSLEIIPIIQTVVDDENSRSALIFSMNQLREKNTQINKTLDWIIKTKLYLRYIESHATSDIIEN